MRRGDVVVARRDVRHQRAKHVERRIVAQLALLLDVHLDQVHRNMARALDHHLDVVLPRFQRQLAQRLQLGELGVVVGVGQAAGTQTVAEAVGHVVSAQDLAQLVEVRVPRILLVALQHPRAHQRAAARLTMPVMRLVVSGRYSSKTPA